MQFSKQCQRLLWIVVDMLLTLIGSHWQIILPLSSEVECNELYCPSLYSGFKEFQSIWIRWSWFFKRERCTMKWFDLSMNVLPKSTWNKQTDWKRIISMVSIQTFVFWWLDGKKEFFGWKWCWQTNLVSRFLSQELVQQDSKKFLFCYFLSFLRTFQKSQDRD